MACMLAGNIGDIKFPEFGAASNLSELKVALIKMLPGLGWRYFLLSEVERRKGGAVLNLLGNLPAGSSAERGEALGDFENPVHRVRDGATAVKWTDVPRPLPLNSPQADLSEGANRCAMVYGLTLTVPSVGGGKILFSVARSGLPDVGDREQAIARHLGYAIAERVIELTDCEGAQELEVLLTARQISCVSLISRGLSDQQIAERFKISAETVKEHVSAARLRLGVRRRTELVYKLTRAGLIL